jgi:hypothetical protein
LRCKKKANLFNEYVISEANVDDTNHELPVLDYYPNHTDKTLSIVQTTEEEVINILFKVDTTKASGHDGIGRPNRIIKLCSRGIAKIFTCLINTSLQVGEYPTEWKKANVSPVYKKDDHQYKKNYRPISLLPSISKIPEKIAFTRLYEFLLEIRFLNDFLSGFRPGDSTVNQLTYIIHKSYEALEMGKEVRMVFLDFSKAFDKVWHKGLLYKLKSLGVKDPLLRLCSYLSDRKQRVVIEGQCSSWLSVEAGVPQGSALGPLLFLIYINDISNNIVSDCLLYADDTFLLEIVDNLSPPDSRLNEDLNSINQWCMEWLMELNPTNCESIIFSTKHNRLPQPMLYLNGTALREFDSHSHLGLTFTSNFSWSKHILSIHQKASKRMNALTRVKYKLNR